MILPSASVDVVYGDPDYNVGIKYNDKSYTKGFDEYIEWYIELAKESMRVLKKEGNIIPIEIKFKEDLKSTDFSGLNVFLDSYKQVKKAYLINLNQQKKEKKISLMLPYLVRQEFKS